MFFTVIVELWIMITLILFCAMSGVQFKCFKFCGITAVDEKQTSYSLIVWCSISHNQSPCCPNCTARRSVLPGHQAVCWAVCQTWAWSRWWTPCRGTSGKTDIWQDCLYLMSIVISSLLLIVSCFLLSSQILRILFLIA